MAPFLCRQLFLPFPSFLWVGHRLIESSMDGLLAKGASQTCKEIAVSQI